MQQSTNGAGKLPPVDDSKPKACKMWALQEPDFGQGLISGKSSECQKLFENSQPAVNGTGSSNGASSNGAGKLPPLSSPMPEATKKWALQEPDFCRGLISGKSIECQETFQNSQPAVTGAGSSNGASSNGAGKLPPLNIPKPEATEMWALQEADFGRG